MNKELILALDALEKENGISKEIMLDSIEKSLMDEYKAEFDKADNGRVELDRKTGDFHIYSDRKVVEKLVFPETADPNKKKENEKRVSGTEIALEDARKIKPDCQIGDIITVEVKSEEFSRKAAKNAKNTIVQTIRVAEKESLYREFHEKEKEVITGVVQRISDNGDMTIDLGRTQTILKADEKFNDKEFKCGDRIKVYVVSVTNKEKNGPIIRISRKSQELVKKLFEEEVTEIKDGVVEIMGIAREAGSRTKMAVRATVPNVDPVGACVGINGARVKAVVNELGNEQIDIIEWDSNSAQLIVNALSPAKVVSAEADDEEKKAKIIVSEQQLSLAIGKSGQNVRLAAKLTGYGIDIKSESAAEQDAEDEELVISENQDMDEEIEISEATDEA
ncbi:MAG: transcription termination factor NusA [Lachnospira sp.]|nr:transcription termination factor NusA [Lachnospira sp.]MDD5828498.1 transcription termination factor NusA [Lachnospira sp.]